MALLAGHALALLPWHLSAVLPGNLVADLVGHLPRLGVALLLGHQGGDGLLNRLALVDGDRSADWVVHGGAHLLGVVVCVALRHRPALLAGNLVAHLVGDLGALLAGFIPALLPGLVPALLTGLIPALLLAVGVSA